LVLRRAHPTADVLPSYELFYMDNCAGKGTFRAWIPFEAARMNY